MLVQMNIKRQPVIQRGCLTIDRQCCTVILSGEQITLYPKEFDVLYLLAQYPGWVLSPEQIYENVWGYDYPADPNNLTSFIRKLRKKIEPESDRPRYIVIVRGVGYKYTENEEMVGKTATPPE